MRSRYMLVLAAYACVACRGQPGSAFSGTALLAPPPDAEAAHDELLNTDIARADGVALRGFAEAFSTPFADDAVYLRGGLPILRGSAAVRAVVSADSAAASSAVRWQPVRAEVSGDRASGYTYGYAIVARARDHAQTSLRVDRYIAFWHKGASGWQIAAYAETYGAPPAPSALPAAGAEAALADVAMSPSRSKVDPVRAADVAFAREAERVGAGEAFGRFASPDAQIFSASGEFITGPDAITASFGPVAANSSFTWQPVYAGVSAAGDLGFTVGNATVTVERENGNAVFRYSKYLTVWNRQRDGSWKYVVDGGSSRPSPRTPQLGLQP